MLIQKAFRYRIYPNQAQEAALAVQFGHARFVYNMALAARKGHYFEHGQGLTYNDTAYMLTVIKRFVPWLKEADSQVLQQALRDLDRAYAAYFKKAKEGSLPKPQPGQKPRKDGMPLGYPRFRSKYDEQSIRYPERFTLSGSRISLPKIGPVRAVFHWPPPRQDERLHRHKNQERSVLHLDPMCTRNRRSGPEIGRGRH